MKKKILILCVALLVGLVISCKKDFLGAKPDKSLLVPTTLTDFQALLDNSDALMNFVPALEQVSSDDFYTTDAGWTGLGTVLEKNSYTWAPDIYEGSADNDWTIPYQQVFYANVVLDGLTQVQQTPSNLNTYNSIKGSALFYRALAFYELAQLFAAPYQSSTAGQTLGIPIRISSDVNIKSVRSTLAETYSQILNDLTEAQNLVAGSVPFKTRPSKAAVLSLLARVYLTMQNYQQAKDFADKSLQLNSQLMDFNTFNTSATRTFPLALPNGNNPEIIFYTIELGLGYNSSVLTGVDTTLYKSYDNNDLRKALFFRNRGNNIYTFKGSYSGTSRLFAGLSTDENYLIRAEANARLGNTDEAMRDLNILLSSRWKQGTFLPLTALDASNALNLILMERRKELLDRGLRWADLRRFNQDVNYAITLTRNINGNVYTLKPNSDLYTFPIPQNEILSNGIQQNPR